MPDFEAPQTAIDWPRLREVLSRVKRTGELPKNHQDTEETRRIELAVSDAFLQMWRARIRNALTCATDDRVLFVLVEGFVLYWDKVFSVLALMIMLTHVFLGSS